MIHNKQNGSGSSNGSHGASSSGAMRIRETADDDINFGEIIGVISANKWFICIFMLVCFVLAALYLYITPLQYKTDALIQVEGKTEDVSSAMQNLSNEINWQSSAAKPSQIEASLIHSRYVLEPTIKRLGLDIFAQPARLPIPLIGRLFVSKDAAISVRQFGVPEAFVARKFYLELTAENEYELYTDDDELVLDGVVGKIARSDDSDTAVPGVKILVSEVHGKIGTKFVVLLKPLNGVVGSFDHSLVITDIGLEQSGGIQGNKAETGILNLALTGTDPNKITKVLNTILYYEVAKNTDKKSAEIEKTLEFLNQQLPDLKKSLDAAETRLSDYRGKKGSLGINVEGSVLFGQLVDEEQKLEQAKLKRAELLQDFTEAHPYVISINQDIQKLTNSLHSFEAKVKTLPKTEQVAINLERDVTTKSELYSYLLGKIQQLQIVKAGTISDVRILVPATASTVVPVRTSVVLLAGLLFGFILGTVTVFVRTLLSRGVSDPNKLEDRVGVPVFAMIPHSRAQEQLSRDMQRKIPGTGPFVLAMRKPKDIAVESLRSLRTTLQFALQENSGNVITVLGGRPSIGKSFVSLNLARVLADSEKKILLIDADLRRGKINAYVSQRATPGFSEVLRGKVPFDEARRILKPENFHFLPAGVFPENPSELLFNGELQRFMKDVMPQYDVIVIDTPPVLAVTDAFIIAKYAAVNLFVVGAGVEPMGAIEHSIKRLQQNGINVNGFVVNNTKQAKGTGYGYEYGYGYGYYGAEKSGTGS